MKLHLPATALAVANAVAVAAPLAAAAAAVGTQSSSTGPSAPLTATAATSAAQNAIRRSLTAARIYHRRQLQQQQIDPSQLPADFSMEDLQAMLDQAGANVDLGDLDLGDMGDMDVGDLESLLGDMDATGGDGGGDFLDGDFLDSLFGGGGSGGGDGAGGMDLSSLGGLICGFMSMVNDDPEMKDLGATCDCAADQDLIMSCTVPGTVCDTPPDGQDEEFCVENSSTVVTIPLDMSGADGGEEDGGAIINASAESCGTYTAPALVAGKEFCFTASIAMDLETMMSSTGEGGAEPDMSEMVECEATLGGKTCECVICDGGMGLKLDCPDVGLVSECTDLTDSAAGGEGGGGAAANPMMDGLPVGSQTSVVRFAQAQDEDSSPAATAATNQMIGAAATAGTTLVVAIATFTGHL